MREWFIKTKTNHCITVVQVVILKDIHRQGGELFSDTTAAIPGAYIPEMNVSAYSNNPSVFSDNNSSEEVSQNAGMTYLPL